MKMTWLTPSTGSNDLSEVGTLSGEKSTTPQSQMQTGIKKRKKLLWENSRRGLVPKTENPGQLSRHP